MTASAYLDTLSFPADRFQREAAEALDRGETVVVTAPTGAGKTVVAEAAIARALERGTRAVYTTPLKALSNQKYGDLRAVHGAANVGLLTGDNAINGRAPIVVMTTEVLRNMMYAKSPDLADIGVAILDEVHYLQDRSRGAVWEEVIIHLDRTIPIVALSATIANPEDFAAWIRARRGTTTLVVEQDRPVPLESTYLVRDDWEGHAIRHVPIFGERGRPNQRLVRMFSRGARQARRYSTPRRFETCEFLNRRGLMPAIYFIFSRAGCEAATGQVVDFGLRLTTSGEAREIRETAERRTAHLSPGDLAVLGYDRWVSNLQAGVAPHHAGMVPAFKETVEELFARGLVKLVFATETLSLGINMPARTVVLETLSKFTGESHELLRPGDYTQLTGRAGRRGVDTEGTAVVLHSRYVPFERAAGIAAAGTHPLISSFRPTYNMAVNLVATYERKQAETLLDASFARFAEERRRSQFADDIAALEADIAREEEAMQCELGDVTELVDGVPGQARAMRVFAARTSTGDVLEWSSRGRQRRQVVVARSHGKRPRIVTVDEEGELHRIGADRIPPSTVVVGRLDLPTPIKTRDARYRGRVATALADFEASGVAHEPDAIDVHPASLCPDIDRHLGAARAVRRLRRRLERVERRAAEVPSGLVPRLRAILRLLASCGYVDAWSLTPAGERLRFIYNELDLLLAEALREGLFIGLSPSEFAAFGSAFTFEPRIGTEAGHWPTRDTEQRGELLIRTWERLAAAEEDAHLPVTRPPEPGFAELAYRWAEGEHLEDLFGDDAPGVGDFVRNCRQLIDLLRQIRDVAPELETDVAETLRRLDRGVVAAAGAL